MVALIRRGATMVMLALVGACASAPPAVPVDAPEDTGAAVIWGDEYDGVQLDVDREFAAAPPVSFAAEATAGEGEVASVRGNGGPFAARWRGTREAQAGALEWRSARVHAVAGSIRPSLAEDAVLADARDATTVSARGSRTLSGLRVAASASSWGSVRGAGVAAVAGPLRLAAAAWRVPESSDPGSAWASVDWRGRTSVIGAAAGGRSGRPERASVYAARARGMVFASCEVSMTPDGPAVAARVVTASGGTWRAAVVAGPARAPTDAASAPARERWGAAVEHHAAWRALHCRTTVSTRTRRAPTGDDRRRRAEWSGEVRVSDAARVEMGVRATRDESLRAPDVLSPPSRQAPDDEVRARLGLRTVDVLGDGTRVEFLQRVDAIAPGAASGRPGIVIVWQARVRHGPLDARVQAGAFDLADGEVAYVGRPSLPGAGAFATLTHRGSDLSAAVRAHGPGPFTAGLQAVADAHGHARVLVNAGVSW